tara:strand:+ start:116 stop:328 length:213 start_codon:yes stop_codon:yes gene_type:complete
MKRIKRYRDNKIKLETKQVDPNGKTIWLPYRPYLLNDIPKNFGCTEFTDEVEGIPEWFNHKGFTYVLDKR